MAMMIKMRDFMMLISLPRSQPDRPGVIPFSALHSVYDDADYRRVFPPHPTDRPRVLARQNRNSEPHQTDLNNLSLSFVHHRENIRENMTGRVRAQFYKPVRDNVRRRVWFWKLRPKSRAADTALRRDPNHPAYFADRAGAVWHHWPSELPRPI